MIRQHRDGHEKGLDQHTFRSSAHHFFTFQEEAHQTARYAGLHLQKVLQRVVFWVVIAYIKAQPSLEAYDLDESLAAVVLWIGASAPMSFFDGSGEQKQYVARMHLFRMLLS